nr:hypothetical protein CKG001_11550 [Bdellovibrio sp. CKG001]
MNLPILAQSPKWIAIDKPAGVSVHNEANDVLHLLHRQLGVPLDKLHLVHRLDKETSGVLLVAKDATTAGKMAEQFQNHLTEKTYYAVLRGSLPFSSDWLEWNQPLSDKAEGRKNPQGMSKDRVPAQTRYRITQANMYFSLAEVRLLTGRQHQIRKHSALAKHAILGDSRYGDPKYNERMAGIYQTSRMFLHAAKLVITFEGATLTFEAPLPEEFLRLVHQ